MSDNHTRKTKKPSKGGPRVKSERIQISVRVERAYMEMAYRYIKKQRLHISDFLERGIVLAVNAGEEEPPVTQQARFLMGEASPEVLRRVTSFMMYLSTDKLTDLERIMRDGINAVLTVFASDPRYWEELEAFQARAHKGALKGAGGREDNSGVKNDTGVADFA